MNRRFASLAATASLTAGALAAIVAPAPASAGVGGGEDRQIVSPAPGWHAYTGLSQAQVSSYLTANKARLTDVKVDYVGATPKYTVAMVGNGGAYASSWYWRAGQTPAQIAKYAADHKARVTALSCYVRSGVKCTAVMIRNTGANAESWKMWVGSIAFVKSKITSTNRMVSLSRVQGSTDYTAVFGSNTGTNKVGWTYYVAKSATAILDNARSRKLRIVDLDRNSNGTYNAIAYANPAGTAWYALAGGTSLAPYVAKANQLGQRIFDVQQYSSGGKTRFAVVMVNQLSGTGAKINGILSPAVPNGSYGFQFSLVGGSTIGSLESGLPFEPASALKVLYHYKNIVAQQAGTTLDGDGVAYRYDPSRPSNGDICTDDFNTVGATNLKNADTLMMQNSDNRMTRGVFEKYGKSAMLAQATSLGMRNVVVKHQIGCPTATTHNAVTLADLSKVYVAYAQDKDITDTAWRTQFHDRMVNESNYSTYKSNICAVAKTEALAIGKTAATATSFCNAIVWLAKGGSYQYGGNDVSSPISLANGSLTSLPYKATVGGSKVPAPRSYFYGDFFDQVGFSTASAKSALGTARTKAYTEAIRPYVRAALKTW